MAFLTKTELFNLGGKPSESEGKIKLTEAETKRVRAKFSTEISVFLSHKHDEIKEFQSALAILSNLGINLYLDWQDEEMPNATSGETAHKLKAKIRSANKFVLLATDGAINSKWCNWELGLGDASKYIDHIAIFPIFNDDNSWRGNEYLQIYPSIEYLDIFNQYIVTYPDGKKYFLEHWLKQNK